MVIVGELVAGVGAERIRGSIESGEGDDQDGQSEDRFHGCVSFLLGRTNR
jgi:hypothetical protein